MNIRRVAVVVAVVTAIAVAISAIGSRTKPPSAAPQYAAPPEIIRLPPVESQVESATRLANVAGPDGGRPDIQRLPTIDPSSDFTRLPPVLLQAPTQSALFLGTEHKRETKVVRNEPERNSKPAARQAPADSDLKAPPRNPPPAAVPTSTNVAAVPASTNVAAVPASTEIAAIPASTEVAPATTQTGPPDQSIYTGNGPLSGEYDFERSMEVSADFETELIPLKVSPAKLNAIRVPRDVARRANKLLDSAISLADRGAIYAARREFLRVTRMIAQALDAQLGQQYHTRALAAGLRALEEADDFAIVCRDDADDDVHLAGFIAGHRTPVLQGVAPEALTPLVAMQRYYEYAQQQLTLAGGHEPTASRSLFSVGRAESLLKQDDTTSAQSGPKAIAFFQAALAVDGTNAKAANELAVMLANYGKEQRAVEVLRGVLSDKPSRTMVLNYAQLCSRLGDQRAAVEARQLAQTIPAQPDAGLANRPRVEWVPPAAFAMGGGRLGAASARTMASPPAQSPKPHSQNSVARQPAAAQPWPTF